MVCSLTCPSTSVAEGGPVVSDTSHNGKRKKSELGLPAGHRSAKRTDPFCQRRWSVTGAPGTAVHRDRQKGLALLTAQCHADNPESGLSAIRDCLQSQFDPLAHFYDSLSHMPPAPPQPMTCVDMSNDRTIQHFPAPQHIIPSLCFPACPLYPHDKQH